MKKIALLGLVILLAFAPLAMAENQPAGTLTFLVGEVWVMSPGLEAVRAEFEMPINAGSSIQTGHDSTCEITLADGSMVRMDQNSEQMIEQAKFTKTERKVSLFARAGRLWTAVQKAGARNDEFGVRTDKAVCAIRGTVFNVDAQKETTDISVYSGKVATWSAKAAAPPVAATRPTTLAPPKKVPGPHKVTMEQWVEIVAAMQRISVGKHGKYQITDLDPEKEARDKWVQWNLDRDRKMDFGTKNWE